MGRPAERRQVIGVPLPVRWPAKKLTIGRYPGIGLAAAHRAGWAALGEVARGNDPAAQKREAKVAARAAARAEKRAELDVVEKVVDEFIERHAKPNTKDWKETKRLLDKDVVAAWKGMRLSEIGKADIHRLLDKMVDRGAAVTANRTFAQLRKMCRWAVSRGIIEHNPCEGIEAPTAEKPRNRVLDECELSLVWRAAGELGFPYGEIVRLLILTGARRDEVAAAQWPEIDLEKKVWNLPAERTKNGRPHSIPLAPAIVAIIEGLPRFEGSPFLFSGKTPPSGFSKAKKKLDAEVARLNGGEPIPHFVLHDLRRSVTSGMASIGIPLHIIERCLNHVSGSFGGIVGVYQRHSFADEMRSAFEAWARHVERIVSGQAASNIVELSSVARG